MQDPKITKELQQFCQADESSRDYKAGALLLCKISGNRVEYKNNLENIESKKSHILKRLNQFLNFRLAAITKEQVAEMKEKVEKIAESFDSQEENFKAGIRTDHESLPEDIQALYKETKILLQKQQQLHLKMRSLALAEAPCPDSELYPFVKEIIDIDKEKLAKWKEYDEYGRNTEVAKPKSKSK